MSGFNSSSKANRRTNLYLISFVEQDFGEIAAVLASDKGFFVQYACLFSFGCFFDRLK